MASKKKKPQKKKKPTKSRSSKSSKNRGLKWFLILFSVVAVYVIFFYTNDYVVNRSVYALERVEENYGHEVDSLSQVMDLPPAYFKSLIMLECSGQKPVESRFEEHIYERLKQVRDKKLKRLETIKPKHLRGMSNEQLHVLASSWGPFQIMGYKSLQMKINVKELNGKKAVYWGMKWINDEYGKLLRKKRYKDAFHFHNTGRHFPDDGESRTYDPKYVTRGLKYVEYFKKLKTTTHK